MAASSLPFAPPSVSASTFRLFVLGELPPEQGDVALVSLAEYRQARALSRTTLRAAELESLRKAIRDLRGFIEAGSPELDRRFLENFGGRLFDIVIRAAVRDLFIAATAQRDRFVPFELFIESSALASWPWEYLFDTGTNMFVCREFHPISRSIFGQTFSIAVDVVRPQPSLLVVIASAGDDADIDVDEEVELLKTVFDRLIKQNKFNIVAEPLSARELTTRLQRNRGQFDIVHFIGHSGFDVKRGEGYLRFSKAGARETSKLYANDFAQAAADSRIRLAFLNACETARAAAIEDPARSSVAAALLGRGIPAVVAHQFSVPDNGAHFFAGVFYDMLSSGQSLIDAVRAGRAAMGHAEDGQFFDWGIPVLYTRDPQTIVFPTRGEIPELGHPPGPDIVGIPQRGLDGSKVLRAATHRDKVLNRQSGLSAKRSEDRDQSKLIQLRSSRPPRSWNKASKQVAQKQLGASIELAAEMDPENARERDLAATTPKLTPGPMQAHGIPPEVTIAVIDIDARAGFLAAVLDAANHAQSYYEFRLEYLPVPTGAVRKGGEYSSPQLFIPALEGFAVETLAKLDTDYVCFLTKNLLAGHGYWNHFAATVDKHHEVFFVSTADLREFAREAGTTYAKAVLGVCLSMLVATDGRWKLNYHDQTAGCLLDYCANRHDMVLALKKMKFDHAPCRSKIKDQRMLAAIDSIIALKA